MRIRSAWLAAPLLIVASCAPSGRSDVEHWVIVRHVMTSAPAMSDDDAAKWHGRSIDLGPDLALAGPDSCVKPMYDSGIVSADSLLQANHLPPGSLGPSLPPNAKVRVTEISCDGETWYSPGALIIRTSPTHAFTPWEGVFFELEKR